MSSRTRRKTDDERTSKAPATYRPGAVGFGTHYLRYSTANALVLLAGLISFPALTRLLDNTQYGILGYYETWVMMAVAFAKLGAQHAIIRFYPHDGDRGADGAVRNQPVPAAHDRVAVPLAARRWWHSPASAGWAG